MKITAGILLALLTAAAFAEPAANGYLFMFDKTPNAAISGHNDKHITDVTPEEAAKACADGGYLSFDYYKETNEADLSYATAYDVNGLKTDYAGNPYDHYSYLGGGKPDFFLNDVDTIQVAKKSGEAEFSGKANIETIHAYTYSEYEAEGGKIMNIPAYTIRLKLDYSNGDTEKLVLSYCPRCGTYYMYPYFDGGLFLCEGDHDSVFIYFASGKVSDDGTTLSVSGEDPDAFVEITYKFVKK